MTTHQDCEESATIIWGLSQAVRSITGTHVAACWLRTATIGRTASGIARTDFRQNHGFPSAGGAFGLGSGQHCGCVEGLDPRLIPRKFVPKAFEVWIGDCREPGVEREPVWKDMRIQNVPRIVPWEH